MYINHVVYKIVLSGEFEKTIVSDRVKKYVTDLYRRYQTDLPINFMQPIYPHDQMGQWLLREIQGTDDLNSVNTIFFPVWGVSWNMDYAVVELHWKKLFECAALLVDVRDCGSLCVYYAIHIMLKRKSLKSEKNTLIASIEHAWLFLKHKMIDHVPRINYLGSFFCSNDSRFVHSLQILSCRIIHSVNQHEINALVDSIIHDILNSHGVSQENCHVWIRENDSIKISNAQLIPHPISSSFLYSCVDAIFKNHVSIKNQHFLIIDFDLSTLSIGAILLTR